MNTNNMNTNNIKSGAWEIKVSNEDKKNLSLEDQKYSDDRSFLGWSYVSAIGNLPSMCEALGLISSTAKTKQKPQAFLWSTKPSSYDAACQTVSYIHVFALPTDSSAFPKETCTFHNRCYWASQLLPCPTWFLLGWFTCPNYMLPTKPSGISRDRLLNL